MPSTIISRSYITDDVKKRLIKLDESLNEGDITKKGYSKQKWSILENYLPDRILSDYKELQNDLEDGNIIENLFYDKLYDLLSEENISEIFLNAKTSTKNVIQCSNSESDIKPSSSANLQNFIYNPCSSSESNNEKNSCDRSDTNSKPKHGNKINNSAITSENKIEDKKDFENHKNDDSNGVNNKTKGDSTNTIKSMFERKRKNKKTEIETEMNTDKKIKIETEEIKEEIVVEEDEKIKTSLKRCEICKQRLDNPDLKFYPGHPPNAVEEFVALTDPKLSLFTGDEEDVHDDDQRPQNKVTFFTVYDKEGHLCSFDSGLIERNAHIYFSGYMKAVYEENPSIEGGVPTKDMGPINEWWISGFDGGEHALLGFSTAFADYYLMEPSEEYRPFLLAIREKIHLSKLVIEFLLDEILQQPTYEDLLNKLETSIPAPGMSAINEETLLRHAQFICDQVTSVDASSNDEDQCLITAPCMRSLIKLAGVTFGKRKAIRHTERKTQSKIKKPVWSKATTTTLVREVFETFFVDQIDSSQKSAAAKRKRCGVCEACQRPDCGDCNACRDMCKFGGTGRAKQACRLRRCPNMAIAEADESEIEDEDPVEDIADESNKKKRWYVHANTSDAASRAVEWTSEVAARHAGRTYYSTASVGGVSVEPGDCVMLAPRETGRPLLVARVAYMWQEDVGSRKMFHAHYFIRGSDTVLGETADSRELFLVNDCESIPLGSIVRQAVVTQRKPSPSWAMNGGLDTLPESLEDDGQHFFFQKKYDPDLARFEDPFIEEKPSEHGPEGYKPCASCRYNSEITASNRPQLFDASDNNTWSSLLWRGRYYNEGVGVYLDPEIFKFKVAILESNTKISNKKDFDSKTYPEFYRKTETVRGSNMETSSPFCIGVIKTITYKQKDDGKPIKPEDVKLQVYKMYRPENTHKGVTLGQQFDFNALYWSDELKDITLAQVEGQCFIACSEALNIPVDKWSALGPNRFYFNQMYNVDKQEFSDVPTRLLSMGMEGKGKGVGKGIKKKSNLSSETKCKPEMFMPVLRPLRALDVFAGCGGLSEGLNQSEIAKSEWAIEKEEPAAHAYKLNNPSATVFTEDCNELLRLVIDGKNTTSRGQKLPQRGDVELLCGGPPCQGFSGMNRFNAGQYSLFKNSLIVSYLSYCDYYRPKFFILENVRNFVSFKRGLVLKLTLRCLIAMGYQCTFGVLQAGNYGVPQTRRRLIILAAAPGQKLPMYPEPTHVFSKQACKLTVMVDEKKFSTNVKWSNSAPYRTVTVRDAMWDLPTVRNGHKLEEMSYDSEAQSHFQRLMRGDQYQPVLRDHICKEMAPIVEARMSFIPTAPGSDWRDLPNIVTRLSDGSYTRKLVYSYYDKQKKLRGVCACFEGKPCCPTDRQDNTLIPWCLPHTADRHNHWAGLYGRLEWDGFFSTTITNPEPMGKQGRVLHPSQNRVVSVRECARSQGFPDTYRFFGNILDKHRQVGNAVPPPMARQIGFEIRKCLKGDDFE